MANNDVDREIQKLKKELSTLKKREELQDLRKEKECLIKNLEAKSKQAHSRKPTHTPKPKKIEVPLLKSKNILLTIFLFIITLGLYVPYWYLSRRERLNKLPSKLKLTKGILIIFMVLMSSRLIVGFVRDTSESNIKSHFFLALNESGELMLDSKDTENHPKEVVIYSTSSLIVFILSISIFIISQSLNFTVKDILQESFRQRNIRDIKLSSFWTFFCGTFYLQHKINQANKKGFYTTTKTLKDVQIEKFLMSCLVLAILLFIITITSVFCMISSLSEDYSSSESSQNSPIEEKDQNREDFVDCIYSVKDNYVDKLQEMKDCSTHERERCSSTNNISDESIFGFLDDGEEKCMRIDPDCTFTEENTEKVEEEYTNATKSCYEEYGYSYP